MLLTLMLSRKSFDDLNDLVICSIDLNPSKLQTKVCKLPNREQIVIHRRLKRLGHTACHRIDWIFNSCLGSYKAEMPRVNPEPLGIQLYISTSPLPNFNTGGVV